MLSRTTLPSRRNMQPNAQLRRRRNMQQNAQLISKSINRTELSSEKWKKFCSFASSQKPYNENLVAISLSKVYYQPKSKEGNTPFKQLIQIHSCTKIRELQYSHYIKINSKKLSRKIKYVCNKSSTLSLMKVPKPLQTQKNSLIS